MEKEQYGACSYICKSSSYQQEKRREREHYETAQAQAR